MSLFHTKAWDMRQVEIAGHSRTILPVIHGESRVPLERTYYFQFPIHNKDARRERDRQLNNITLLQYIIEASRRNPWLVRFLAMFLLFVGALVLVFFPPAFVVSSAVYRRLSHLPGKLSGIPALAVSETRLQYRDPEKLMISSNMSVTGVSRMLHVDHSAKMDEMVWRAPMAREIQELEETYARSASAGLGLRPGEGIATVIRGDVRNGNGQPIRARDVIQQDTTIATGSYSFLQIWLQDGSTLSIGPDSTLRLEPASGDEPATIELGSGSVRAMVRRTAAMAEASQGDRLYVRTRGAVLDVRGSDSLVSVSAANEGTTVLTFEGRVVFAKRAAAEEPSARALAGKDAKQVAAGGYSESRSDLPAPTLPTLLPAAQLDRLKLSSDIIGTQEVEQQQQSFRYIADLEKSGMLRFRENPSLLRYEALTDEQLSDIAAHVVRRERPTPKAGDYERVEAVPPELAADRREFPDQDQPR